MKCRARPLSPCGRGLGRGVLLNRLLRSTSTDGGIRSGFRSAQVDDKPEPAPSSRCLTRRGGAEGAGAVWSVLASSARLNNSGRRCSMNAPVCHFIHRITSSARSRIDSGMVIPRALAVLRLTTSSNWVGCSIGRSPGLAPFRILST